MSRALGAREATDLVLRHLRVPPAEVVVVKALLEAHEGLGALFAEQGGDITLATTPSQEAALDAFVDDLRHVVRLGPA